MRPSPPRERPASLKITPESSWAPRHGDLRAGATAAAFGVTASWVGGGLLCAALVSLALLVPALRRYDARAAARASDADAP